MELPPIVVFAVTETGAAKSMTPVVAEIVPATEIAEGAVAVTPAVKVSLLPAVEPKTMTPVSRKVTALVIVASLFNCTP